MIRTTAVIPAALLITALAACSGSTGGKVSSSSGSPPSKSALAAMVLKPADLPAGWKGTPSTDDTSGDNSDQARIAKCVGAKNTSGDQVAVVNSDDFANGDSQISSSATAMRTRAAVNTDIGVLHRPKIDSCFASLFRSQLAKELPSGAKAENFKLHVSPGPGNGPGNVAGRVTGSLSVQAQGQTVPVYISVALIAGPLVEADVDFFGIGAPIDSNLQQQLIGKVAQRVKG